MGSDKVKNWVTNLYIDYKTQYKREPSFEDLIKDCIHLKGIDIAEYLFNSLQKGWLDNSYPEIDFKELHKNLFCDSRNYYYSELKLYLDNNADSEFEANFRQNSREEVDEYNENLLKSINQNKE